MIHSDFHVTKLNQEPSDRFQAYITLEINHFISLQPEFGMKIKTPPQNRKPMALIETEREYESESSPHASKCRTAGVGNEDGLY